MCYISRRRTGGSNITAKNRLYKKIHLKGKNWVFSAIDFLPDLKRWEIDQSFISLEKEGKITRVLPGLYYYPEYSEILQKKVAPNIAFVAEALARKYDWKIFPEGSTALNYLGLSTQIPSKYIYISSGSPRKYKIGKIDLEFRHRVLTEIMIKNEKAMLVIQSLKSVGQVHANIEFVESLSKRFSYSEWVHIEKASHKVTGWVLNIISKAKEFSKNG